MRSNITPCHCSRSNVRLLHLSPVYYLSILSEHWCSNVVFSLDPAQSGGGEVIEDASSLYKDPVTTDRPTDENKRRKGDRPIAPVHFICIELIATGFLRHMVRRIIGSVRPIAEGTYPPTRMKQILDGEIEPGPSAPTKGLWLHRTWLTEEDWNKDTTKDE